MFWDVLIRYFVECSTIWYFSDICLMIRLELWGFWRKSTEVKCRCHYIIWRLHISTWLITVAMDLNHLANLVFQVSSLSSCLSPFCTVVFGRKLLCAVCAFYSFILLYQYGFMGIYVLACNLILCFLFCSCLHFKRHCCQIQNSGLAGVFFQHFKDVMSMSSCLHHF